jgi:hypothetical protein
MCGLEGHGAFQSFPGGKLKGELKCTKHRNYINQLNMIKLQHGLEEEEVRALFKLPPNSYNSSSYSASNNALYNSSASNSAHAKKNSTVNTLNEQTSNSNNNNNNNTLNIGENIVSNNNNINFNSNNSVSTSTMSSSFEPKSYSASIMSDNYPITTNNTLSFTNVSNIASPSLNSLNHNNFNNVNNNKNNNDNKFNYNNNSNTNSNLLKSSITTATSNTIFNNIPASPQSSLKSFQQHYSLSPPTNSISKANNAQPSNWLENSITPGFFKILFTY